MDEKVIEKLKETSIAEKILEVNDAKEVTEVFKNAGVEISEKDAKDVFEGKENLFLQVANMSKEEIEKCTGGELRWVGVGHGYANNSSLIYPLTNNFDPQKGLIANLTDNVGISTARLALQSGMNANQADTAGTLAAYATEGAVGIGLLGAGATLAATTIGTAVGIKKVVHAAKKGIKKLRQR